MNEDKGIRPFKHPVPFWLGIGSVCAGVGLHLPMFLAARPMHYAMAGMGWDHWMIIGMFMIVGGVAAVLYGLSPTRPCDTPSLAGAVEVSVPDDGQIGRPHLALMATLTLAVAIDTMKPFTFTFILPGVAHEYQLSSPAHHVPGALSVALFPLAGIVGTTIGSLLLGYLGDRFGRRQLILLAGTLFIATSACGAMPAYAWNLTMCFIMGIGVGGLLPLSYSLLAETIPAHARGQVVVLVAGIGTALGFLWTSWAAHWLIPIFSWRIMWLIGLFTGLALVLLQRFIPESPRFLLATGREREAQAIMRAFGATAALRPQAGARVQAETFSADRLLSSQLFGITAVLCLYGIGWGLVNFGFLTWLPIDVGKGTSAAGVTTLFAQAALFALPGSVVVAWLYGRWSSKGTLIASATAMAADLAIFALSGNGIAHHHVLFTALVTALLVSMWGTIAALSPYAAEVYPTTIRSGGSGVVAGATKLGGVIALGMAAAAVSPPDIAGSALISALPAAAAALLLVRFGTETSGRRLEVIAESTYALSSRQ